MLILLKLFYRFKIVSNKIPGSVNVGTEIEKRILKLTRNEKSQEEQRILKSKVREWTTSTYYKITPVKTDARNFD